MGVDLLKHNQEAYEKVQKAISEGKKKIAVSHATGTGKSYLITKLFEDFSNDKKLVLVPSTYISDQIQKLFEKYNIQKVDVMRYQKLIKMSDEDIAAMDYDVIALDEYHHDTSKVWGNKVRTLIDTHSESIIFGTSATPVRSDGVNTIDELFEGNCASDLPLSEGIAKKIVPLPKYVGALYELDDELTRLRKKVEQATNTKEEKQEFYKKIDLMRSQIEKSYGMPIILNKHIKDKEGKYLVFCKKKRHLQEIKETVIGWFRTAGCKNINAYEVYSDYENKDAEYKAFCEDTSHNLKLLFCVNMLNEGLHLENISGVLLLRPTRSSIVWHQQIGRAIEANNTNTPVIIDAVNNFSAVGQGMELLKEIKDAVAKEKESDPDFDDGGFEDIDTFFVLEQILEVHEMFAQIEGRLQDNWDAMFKKYCKFYEENGHGDVPKTEEYKKLSNWCKTQRRNMKDEELKEYRKKLLDEHGFIWNVSKYIFEKNVRCIVEYYNQHREYPSIGKAIDEKEKNLVYFINNERTKIRNESYPEWKNEIINKYIPDFSWENYSEKSFNRFIYFMKLYMQRNGHVEIKFNEIIDGYKIGMNFNRFLNLYKRNKLSDKKISQLKELGIVFENKNDINFKRKMEIVKQAVNEGIIINSQAKQYKTIDIYEWIMRTVKRRYLKGNLSQEQKNSIEKLVGKSLDKLFNGGIAPSCMNIKVLDVLENKEVGTCKSQHEVSNLIWEKYNIKVCHTTIGMHLRNKIDAVCKGRFRFEYVDNEIVH